MASAPVMSRVAGLELGEQFIRADIRRILLLLAAVAVILVILIVLNHNGTALFQAGRNLASFMRLAS